MRHIDEDKRREWLRALRLFKYGVRVRAKLGLIQEVCDSVHAQRSSFKVWEAPDWRHDRWVTMLCEAIRNNQFPIAVLRGFAETSKVSFFNMHVQPTPDGVVDAMNDVCRIYSVQLRKKFGVFKEADCGNHEKTTEEVSAERCNT